MVIIFYFLIPLLGAFNVRRKWRLFRKRIISSSLLPRVKYSKIRQGDKGFLGFYRFFGNLEAIQDDDTIWVKNGSISISVNLKNILMYVLPSFSLNISKSRGIKSNDIFSDEMPREVSYSKLLSLPEGTQIFISGSLYLEKGHGVFRTDDREQLFILIYDGDENTIIKRSIWGGRQRNEYWNKFTAGALTIGSFSLLILSYTFLHTPLSRFPALLAITLSLVPVLPLLPPGAVFFFVYRYFWKRGRFLRAERDMIRLPLRYCKNPERLEEEVGTELPDGEKYLIKKYPSLSSSLRQKEMGRAEIRSVSLIDSDNTGDKECYVYGGCDSRGNITNPEDPMAEFLIIPGSPCILSGRCGEKARQYEVLSGIVFTIGFLMNYILAFYSLAFLVK